MVKVYAHSQDNEYTIILKGHADYSDHNDIVCSAISAIIQSFICYLENSEDKLTQKEVATAPGDVHIHACGEIEEAFKLMLLGLKCIELNYPDNVKVSG